MQHYKEKDKRIFFIWKFCHSVAPPLMQFALLHLAQWGKSGKKVKFEKYVWVVVVEDFIPSEIWFHEIFFLHFFADFSTLCSSSLLCFSSKKRHVHTSCQHAKGNEFIHEMLEEERNIVGLLYISYVLSISTNSATFWTPERFLEVFPKKNPTTIIFMKTWSEDTLQK